MNNSNYVKRYRTIERYCNVEKLKISRKDDLSTNYNDISSRRSGPGFARDRA